jgi:SET domain-containing protein
MKMALIVTLGNTMQGVTTTTTINKDDVIYQFVGTFIKNPTRTSIQVGKKQHVEDALGRYINHSCTPNIKIVKEDKIIKLIAIKDIQEGQEITFDYNSTEWKLFHPFKCNCHGILITGKYYKVKD